MCFNTKKSYILQKTVRRLFWGVSLILIAVVLSCGVSGKHKSLSMIEYSDGVENRNLLTYRFAPKLFLHADEPYEIFAVIPVCHPEKPIIAYHLFFEHDAVVFGGGTADHEIIWVQYDPVTLKITDVFTLWHRTVIRTDFCVFDAKVSGQRASIMVQWGQHGMLPLGWESILSVRPRLEFRLHYNLVHHLNHMPKIGSRRSAVVFEGSYEDYKRFPRMVDLREIISDRDVIVALYSENELKTRLPKSTEFKVKKEWPDW